MNEMTMCDLNQVREMVGDDQDAFAAVLEVFRSGLPECMGRVQALIAQNDREALAREAHSIKGFARSLGADRAGALAVRLEDAAMQATWEEISALSAKLIQDVDAILPILDQAIQGTMNGQCADR